MGTHPRAKDIFKNTTPSRRSIYSAFDEINGRHPWREKIPEGYILYPVRKIENAKVIYFNFALAEEMGLIPTDHPNQLNKTLEKKILDTFAIQIINEFEQEKLKAKKVDLNQIPHFMATRYLQLQHQSKTGKTSGDGRSIWNGVVKHKGTIWDISSRGTGVTALAPGAVEAGKPIPTGCEDFGYGCGLAELDELIASAIMSEIFHRQGLKTERVLAVIQTSEKTGIGVRAGTNLIRPAHVFLHLKQGNLSALTRALDYIIERQVENKEWNISTKGKQRFDSMLSCIEQDFARFAARLDADYIFVWLDWDGDNVLTNAGIIDYGSVRQFGVRHDQYRFDDGPRYSTNLNEQKIKAQQIVQTFAQAIDFVKTGKKKPLENFKDHPIVQRYQQDFELYRQQRILYRLGFDFHQCDYLIERHYSEVSEFTKLFNYFERKKSKSDFEKVPDGINKPALFNMRTLFRSLPELYYEVSEIDDFIIQDSEILAESLSEYATSKQRKLSHTLMKRLIQLQVQYKKLLYLARGRRSIQRTLRDICTRARIINKEDRITGNGIEFVVESVLTFLKKGTDPGNIQKAVEEFIRSQVLVPEFQKLNKAHTSLRGPSKAVFKSMIDALKSCKDDI